MNDIMRRFIARQIGFVTMEKTSGEILMQLKEINFPTDAFMALAQTLRMGDAVKFAKYMPSHEDNEQNFDTIRNSIELLNKRSFSAVQLATKY